MTGEPGGIAASVRRQIGEGRSPEEIVNGLVAEGLSKGSAERFVERAMNEPVPLANDAPAALDAEPARGFPWIRAAFAAAFVALAYPGYVVVRDAVAARRDSNEEWVRTVRADRRHAESVRAAAGRNYEDRAAATRDRVAAAIETLRSGRESDQCNAAMVLGQSLSETAIEPLIAAIRSVDASPHVQRCIAGALVELGEVDVPAGYYNMWIDGTDPDLWRSAIIGYGELGHDAPAIAVKGLERALLSEHWDMRLLAVMSAAKIGSAAASVLKTAAEDEHPHVRMEARNALQKVQ